jgi:DNA polymerase III subunit epsilon
VPGVSTFTVPPSILEQPLASAEFIALDTETNGLGGASCELTELGAVLLGGGELHDRFQSLVRTNMPLGRGIQRFTGITQAEIDRAPEAADVLPSLSAMLAGRVLVAHNASFDRRVLKQAYERIGLEWPDPPVLCTAAMARRLLPLQRERKLASLADALGVEISVQHRALPDAEACGRIFCALFTRLCAAAGTVGEAVALLAPGRAGAAGGSQARRRRERRYAAGARELPALDFGELPRDPGVYIFRDDAGKPLYVGKSVSIRSRARAHFAPSVMRAEWTSCAKVVDYVTAGSELGALLLENRLIKQLAPPGNVRLRGPREELVYITCRLDIAFPILEVADSPAAGLGVTIGPLRGRAWVEELVEQLESLFGLRVCGRRLPRRQVPSVYGQMGRCLSPCLGDLDPNLYRRRLDAALACFRDGADLLTLIDAQMAEASGARQYERAAALRRRRERVAVILENVEGLLQAAHVVPRLVLAPHPLESRFDALWLAGGRVVEFRPLPSELGEVFELTVRAVARGGRTGETGAFVPPGEVDELRIVTSYLASHPQLPQLPLAPAPSLAELEAFLAQAKGSATTSTSPSFVPTGASRRTKARAIGPKRGDSAALVTVATTRS